MDKSIIKKGFDAAEKEHQEQEVTKIKNIVQKHLEKIDELSTRKKEIEEEIKVHKNNLDDLKAGRLDRVEERTEKDPNSKKHTLIIVKKIEREYIPLQPWRSIYTVDWVVPYYSGNSGAITFTTGTNSVVSLASSTGSSLNLNASGTSFANFTGGSYEVGNHIVNL